MDIVKVPEPVMDEILHTVRDKQEKTKKMKLKEIMRNQNTEVDAPK
jgi:hypothetical protein